MKKWVLLLLLLLVLAACSGNDNVSNDKNNDSNIKADVKVNGLSEKEAINIAENILINLEKYTYASEIGPYKIYEGVDYTEKEWDEITDLQKQELQKYATNEFVATYLQVDTDDCAQTCRIDFPVVLSYGWDTKAQITSEDTFTITSIVRPFLAWAAYDYDSAEQTLQFIKENGNWKLQQQDYEIKDMNLAAEDVETYLKGQGFTNVTIEPGVTTFDIEGKEEKAVAFIDNNLNDPFFVILRTGHIEFTGEHDEFSGEGDYSINNEDDYVMYNLFYEWEEYSDKIDVANPQVSALYDALLQLDEQRLVAYADNHKEQLATIIDELYQLSKEVYVHYEQQWDDEQKEMESSRKEQWDREFNYYFTNILDENKSDIDRLNNEAIIVFKNILSVLVTANTYEMRE